VQRGRFADIGGHCTTFVLLPLPNPVMMDFQENHHHCSHYIVVNKAWCVDMLWKLAAKKNPAAEA
jgi:hypothetical protein